MGLANLKMKWYATVRLSANDKLFTHTGLVVLLQSFVYIRLCSCRCLDLNLKKKHKYIKQGLILLVYQHSCFCYSQSREDSETAIFNNLYMLYEYETIAILNGSEFLKFDVGVQYIYNLYLQELLKILL